jgi:hypothetical protein
MEITHRKDRSQHLPKIYQIISNFKSMRLTVNIKLALVKAFIRSVMTCLFHLGNCGGIPTIEIAAPAKPGSAHHWKFSKAPFGPRITCDFPNSVRV